MSDIQPDRNDAILGGQTPPPVNAAVLGGVAGAKQQIDREWGLSDRLVTRAEFETVFANDNAEIIERTLDRENYTCGYIPAQCLGLIRYAW